MTVPTRESLLEIIEPVVETEGYELVELEYAREGGWILRLFIDRPEVGVGLDDCVALSRQISAFLDANDSLPDVAYSLEVSSPGVRRPLRKPEHFLEQVGERVRVQAAEVITSTGPEGQPMRRKKFIGLLKEFQENTISIVVDDTTYRIPLGAVQKANLEPDMGELVARALDRSA